MTGRYDDDVSHLQETNLLQESDSAKHLIAYGIRTLRTTAFIETTRDPIMTMLSIGIEKMLKLALGLLYVEANRVWLPAAVLKNEYRHDLVKMESLLRAEIHSNIGRATHAPYVTQALSLIDDDPVWPALVSALNRYGKEGRFYYLDALAENPQPEDSPASFWDAAERIALDHDAELTDLRRRMLDDFSLSDEFYRSLNGGLASSLQNFWDLVTMAGIQGVLGARGEVWGHDFKNVGRQIDGD